MFKRFLIFGVLLALLHIYIAWQLLPHLNLSKVSYRLSIACLIFSALIIPLGLSARFLISNKKLLDLISWIGMSMMGLFSSLLVLTFIRQIILGFYLVFAGTSKSLSYTSALAVVFIALFLTILGFINARRTAVIVEIIVPIKNLPAGLTNFKIAQISDIHVGPTIKHSYLQAIVNEVNKLQADMIAVTGDLVDGSVRDLATHTRSLAELKAKHGSFFVLGNHEYYSGAEEWIAEIKSLGLVVLLNEHKIIEHNNAKLLIAGVTDYSGEHFLPQHKSDPQKALAGAPSGLIKILLAHQPRSALLAEKYAYDLQLSGHTHGGQFWPWNFFVRMQQPFNTGLKKLNKMWVYVNRGSGYWGPPKRLGLPPEITLIKLVPDSQ